jgi:hypothetical protein
VGPVDVDGSESIRFAGEGYGKGRISGSVIVRWLYRGLD